MMIELLIKSIAGAILTVFGYLDAVKYHLEASKIRTVKTSKGHSRKFINIALGNDLYRLFYFVFIDKNPYLLISCIFALVFMIEMWYMIYLYYPYQTYPRKIVKKRPNIFSYIYNSLIPNKYRRHL